jgi:nicotinamide-nucleotide amidase
MIGEIIATGDEILSGALIDGNSAYIAEKLKDAGVHITRHHCVGDELNELVAVFKEIARRSDLAVVTGGLGPTADDRTAEAAAQAAGVQLVEDELALKSVEDFFTTRNRKMTDPNLKQAMLPEGSECLYNPVGTAPGFKLMIERCALFFLPGVPHEMHHMLSNGVLPRIAGLVGKNRAFYGVKTISTFGLTEALTAERLCEFETAFEDIQLGLRAKFPEIHIKLYASALNKDELGRRLAVATNWVKDKKLHRRPYFSYAYGCFREFRLFSVFRGYVFQSGQRKRTWRISCYFAGIWRGTRTNRDGNGPRRASHRRRNLRPFNQRYRRSGWRH